MSAPHLRRRYRTTGPRRGLTYLFLILLIASVYVGQRVYTERQRFAVGRIEQRVKVKAAQIDSLRAERDRLTGYDVVSARAEALGLRPAQLDQLARVPLYAPPPYYAAEPSAVSVGETFARVWNWLDGPTVGEQRVEAAP